MGADWPNIRPHTPSARRPTPRACYREFPRMLGVGNSAMVLSCVAICVLRGLCATQDKAGFPRMSLLGDSVNRDNGAALSGDCPGIYERRGKDSNLRGLTPTPQLGHLRKLARTGAEHFLESAHGLPYGFAAPGSSSPPETFLPALTAPLPTAVPLPSSALARVSDAHNRRRWHAGRQHWARLRPDRTQASSTPYLLAPGSSPALRPRRD